MASRPPSTPPVPWRVRDLVLVVIATFVLLAAGLALLRGGVDTGLLPLQVARGLSVPLVPLLLGAVPLAYLALRFPQTTWLLLGRHAPIRRDVWRGARVGAIAFLVHAVAGAITDALSDAPLEDLQRSIREVALDPALRPIVILSAVCLAPVTEELFFRGFVYQGLRNRVGAPAAMALSAAFFAVLHVDLETAPWASAFLFAVIFGLGVAMAWLFERYQTLVVPIVVHATFNLLGVIALLIGAMAG